MTEARMVERVCFMMVLSSCDLNYLCEEKDRGTCENGSAIWGVGVLEDMSRRYDTTTSCYQEQKEISIYLRCDLVVTLECVVTSWSMRIIFLVGVPCIISLVRTRAHRSIFGPTGQLGR